MPLVLVVEPDGALRDVLCRVLGRHGYHTLPAGSAAEAAAVVRGRSVDLLLTEVALPDSTGPALAARLGAGRVLCTSGGGDNVSAPLLVKPFSPQELLERMREVLPPVR